MHNNVGFFVIIGIYMILLVFNLQLEVLGRSLLWDNICKRIEYDPHIKDSPVDSVVQDINLPTSSHGRQTSASPQNTSVTTSQNFDLLSGWPEPEVLQTSSQNTNPFHNDVDLVHTATNPFISWDPFAPSTSDTTTNGLEGEWQSGKSPIRHPQTKAKSATAAEDYIEIVNSFVKSDPVCDREGPLFGCMSNHLNEILTELADKSLSSHMYALVSYLKYRFDALYL